MSAHDVIVIGAGPNGLVAAAILARAGIRPLVVERRDSLGGTATTHEIHPGFRCPALLHTAGPLVGGIARELELERHGLQWLQPDVRVLSPSPDGHFIALYDDAARTAEGLKSLGGVEAESYAAFAACTARIGKALSPLLTMTPPSIDAPTMGELWRLLRLGRRVRKLGARDVARVLRWGPMAAADLVAEWFENDLLRATVAARGIFASTAGPWSAGTSAPILLQAAHDGHATLPAAFPRGGMGALSQALADAARAAGATIRTGAGVARIAVVDGAATGVVLDSGEEIAARAVVSAADPRTTFLRLLDSALLGPDFVGKMSNYRSVGSAAKVNLALSRLPHFSSLAREDKGGERLLGGRIHVGPDIDSLERAYDASKYGEISRRPYLDVTIPSLLDTTLAPEGAHVMSIHAQFAPYTLKTGSWETRRDELRQRVLDTLAEVAPDIAETVVAAEVLTPVDIEARFGMTGGHLLHGEPALDQLFAFRPLIGWAQYRSPIAGLYLCGSGTHPGGGVNGAPGANAGREVARAFKKNLVGKAA